MTKFEGEAKLGPRIEERAARWLEEPGTRVIARNYRRKTGELDIVLEERRFGGAIELVVVEVRARSRAWGEVDAVASVTYRKRRRLRRTAEQFLAAYRGPATSLRFDLVTWCREEGFSRLVDAWRFEQS